MGTRRIWTTPSYNRFAVTLDGICLAQPDMRRRSPLSPQCLQHPTGAAFLPHSADSGEGRDQALVAAQNEGVAEGRVPSMSVGPVLIAGGPSHHRSMMSALRFPAELGAGLGTLQGAAETPVPAIQFGAGAVSGLARAATTTVNASDPDIAGYLHRGARISVSFADMIEGSANSGADVLISDPIETLVPDLPTNAFFAYGHYEGTPRVLDLRDKHGTKLSAVTPRGHEADAHGQVWENSFQVPTNDEMRFIADSVQTIRRVTGQKPIGWNAYWMRSSIRILETLQQLGFLSQVDRPSREPFIVPASGSDFMNVHHSFQVNEILSLPFEGWDAAAYQQALRAEFDQLSEEGANRRRMLVLRLHDRISVTGLPGFRGYENPQFPWPGL
jgi:hypothetical protein